MGADFGALLQHADSHVLAALGGELAQPDRCREAGRAATDDDDIEFHRFAFNGGF